MSASCRFSQPAWFVFAVLIMGRSVIAQQATPTPTPPTPDNPTSGYPTIDFDTAATYRVVRIIDNSRVVVLIDNDETTVQMAGVGHTGEGFSPLDPNSDQVEASRFTDRLLRGESVYLEDLGSRNGQRMAHVFRAPDGLFVNAEIIRQGFGKTHQPYDGRYANLFHFCEHKARQALKGLWDPWETSASLETASVKAIATPRTDRQHTVYVASSGSRYHAAGCSHLAPNPIPMSVYKAITGFQWCDQCKPPK